MFPVPVGRTYAIVLSEELPDQVKSALSGKGVDFKRQVAFADVNRGSIFFRDRGGDIWVFIHKDHKWESISTHDDIPSVAETLGLNPRA